MTAAAPLLSVRDLSVAFRHGGETHVVVDRVSFTLERGQALALVGESGSGKIGHRAVDRASCCPIRRRAIRRARSCSRAATS